MVYLACQANDSNGTTTAEEEDEDEEVVEEDEETLKNTKQNEISSTSTTTSTGVDPEGVMRVKTDPLSNYSVPGGGEDEGEGQPRPGLNNNKRYKIITASQLG